MKPPSRRFRTSDEARTYQDNLHASSPRHRVLAYVEPLDIRSLPIDDWLSRLDDEDLDVRREALTLIAYEKISSIDIFNQIVEALAEPDPWC